MAVPLVMNAWYHAGSAEVALELITNIEDPERRGALAELFTAPPDLPDWTAFSLGTRSAISTLDLCAAAAWRLSDVNHRRAVASPFQGGTTRPAVACYDCPLGITSSSRC
jgi:hypothetical protein